MASYNIVLAAVIALAISSCNCRADLIDEVCAKSDNENLCIVTLRLDPRSTQPQTYRLLAEIAVDGAINTSKWAADVARKVDFCADALGIAHTKMGQAKDSLKKLKDANTREYVDMFVSQAWAESYMCSISTPNNLPVKELKLYNGNFMTLAILIRRLIFTIPLV